MIFRPRLLFCINVVCPLLFSVIGIDRFGESAPAGQLFEMFGFTVANVVKTAKALLS